MNLKELKAELSQYLETHLKQNTPAHSFAAAYRYAVLPPGKLFRPQLVASLAHDLGVNQLSLHGHHYLASSVELHHAYSLAHDDLPCMDDDDMRRGRPSLHRQYNEWSAVLVGDGLLNASYRLIANIQSPAANQLFRYFSWALGPKGLIQGQVMDLGLEATSSFDALIKTHLLKTSRLIQVSLVGATLLVPHKNQSPFKQCKRMHRAGEALGIIFQLLDDLSELTEKLSPHELSITPWPRYPKECRDKLKESSTLLHALLPKENFPLLRQLISQYIVGVMAHVNAHALEVQDKLAKGESLKEILEPVMTLA
jgi:geranylgeranyl pyrophosphate synthase